MILPPLITAGFVFIATIVILLVRQASLEGKLIMVFGALALGAFLRLHFYLLLLVALAFFVFIFIAWLWALIASSRLVLKRELKREAMVGENVPVRYRLVSRSPLPLFHSRIWDRISRERSDGRREELDFEQPGYIAMLSLKPRESIEGSLHFTPPVRGRLMLGPIAVEGGDPFGIFTLTKWLPVADDCLVLPGWVLLGGLPSVPARLGSREQEHLVPREGHSHEFLGIRPYSDGDSLRGVHWPLTARHDRLIVRQFQKEVEEEMLLILDADRQADIGEGAENALEYLITLALSLANAASGMGRPWTLVVVSEKIQTITHGTKEAILTAQHALAKLKADRAEPIEAYLEQIRRDNHRSACILLTARTDNGPSVTLAQEDSTLGGGINSVIVRVDPSGFQASIEKGIANIKRRRKPAEMPSRAPGGAYSAVIEYSVARGDNLADLFFGRAYT